MRRPPDAAGRNDGYPGPRCARNRHPVLRPRTGHVGPEHPDRLNRRVVRLPFAPPVHPRHRRLRLGSPSFGEGLQRALSERGVSHRGPGAVGRAPANRAAGYQFTGLRAWKNNSGTKTYFLYGGTTPVVELDASGNVLAANTFGAAELLARRASGATSFYTFDLQGNVAQRLGSTGGVQASFNYDAYGVGHVTTV